MRVVCKRGGVQRTSGKGFGVREKSVCSRREVVREDVARDGKIRKSVGAVKIRFENVFGHCI